ncbi:MAG: DUF1971 domain-containing protein [Pseudomonadota bacterium]|nr:DUF1971 domain-containing protein [Pseudomonadota bacterium]
MVLPTGLRAVRRTPVFDETGMPDALRKDHSTREGTWGLIHVLSGRLVYRVTDPRRPARETELTPASDPGLVEPTILHAVEPVGPVRFFVAFYREG